ncbi:unnamed protein product [Arctia plantaginis]|uniref:C4H2-type domain-containing protein n=1 Tax=Arctia plantaginis TaxID=874455 RepID=A0A8S1B950_ARCPL|nr:unnamed protein product [Arctia plantaginis]
MTAENEREIYHKLEAMKEISEAILNEVRSGDQEGRCLAQYKREMELLQQEKMSHVEELRQIHADINAMETVIKQTEESMTRKLSNASRLHEDYRPLKTEVDLLRRQCLGLDRLPDLHEEEGSPITPDRFPALPAGAGASAGPGGGAGAGAAGPGAGLVPAAPRRRASRRRRRLRSGLLSTKISLPQQPPPMKSCLSCHQQIHRNAPICPLCKAKSRSRNPKKPKKK